MASSKLMTFVKCGLFLCIFDVLGMLPCIRSEVQDVDGIYAAYFEQPCCPGGRHVRHHKGKGREKKLIDTLFRYFEFLRVCKRIVSYLREGMKNNSQCLETIIHLTWEAWNLEKKVHDAVYRSLKKFLKFFDLFISWRAWTVLFCVFSKLFSSNVEIDYSISAVMKGTRRKRSDRRTSELICSIRRWLIWRELFYVWKFGIEIREILTKRSHRETSG